MSIKDQLEKHREQLPAIRFLQKVAAEKSVEFNKTEGELIDQYIIENKLFSKSQWIMGDSYGANIRLDLDLANSSEDTISELKFIISFRFGPGWFLDGTVQLSKYNFGTNENGYQLSFDNAIALRNFIDRYGLNLAGAKEYFTSQLNSINEIIKLLGI